MKGRLVPATLAVLCLCAGPAGAAEPGAGMQSSLFVAVDLGAAFDLDEGSRTPPDVWRDGTERTGIEAYSLASFLFGLSLGYRINEIVGIEGGWHEQQHRSHPEWGDSAHYRFGHLALRLAWPLRTRQTPVLSIGPTVGSFTYGAASYGAPEDNVTLVVGGMARLTLEHEFALGIVGKIDVAYLPTWRRGMDGVLRLEEHDPDTDTTRYVDGKDFTDDALVHILWISAGVQFEWTFH